MEQLFLETASRHMKDKKVTMNIWHGFMKWKSGLSNILPFYKDKASLVDEGRAVDVVYLDFSKALGTISHNIFIDKLTKYKSDRCTVKWIENWLNYQTQKVMISDTELDASY